MATPQAPPPMATRKSVTGFVTKLVGDGATYGFINDEIFFQQANVTDGPAGSGDRVFAECEYSENLPIKWNATSIKILARAGQQQAPPSSILESDPRRQSRQAAGLLNQQAPMQQQPPPVSAPEQITLQPPQVQQQQQPPVSVANTYQQHRQQRQQQHDVSINQPPPLMQQPPPQQQPPTSLPMGILDQAQMNLPPPDYFNPFAQPPVHQTEIQPFQHDTPMGPPKLEYTSQLGSAFVQNQFMTGPLIPPQPAGQPMLPQLQPQQQLHQRQQQQQQSNQRDQRGRDRDNKSGAGGNRFSDNNNKNDRNQNNRGRQRNDNNRGSSDRESPANARSSRSSDTRDRSGQRNDRGGKRDDSSSRANRQSPVTNSARSANSVSSDRGHKSSTGSRRSYDPQNIPRSQILTNLNPCNMRARCGSSVHVPSDLKSVVLNKFLRLDIKNTPKPLMYKIEESKPDEQPTKDGGQTTVITETDKTSVEQKPALNESAESNNSTVEPSKLAEKSDQQQSAGTSTKNSTKMSNKYGVKVVLISIPELETIYKKVFGQELDAYSTDSKSHARLDEAITMLCNKGANGGHSLVGGKFDPTLDGFVEGEFNEFERHGQQPDLIATCKRVVMDQTGLDLGNCQGWTLVSTFLYNHKSDYFTSKASVEYSYIYLPHIWTILPDDFDSTDPGQQKAKESQIGGGSQAESQDVNMTEENQQPVAPETENKPDEAPEVPPVSGEPLADAPEAVAEQQQEPPTIETTTPVQSSVTLENISDLKVADLKLELDKRDIKYKPNAKKAELAQALQESLTNASAAPAATPQVQGAPESGQPEELEEGEVVADDDTNTEDTTPETGEVKTDTIEATSAEESTNNKRKSEDVAEDSEPSKKICNQADEASTVAEKKDSEKVSLIKEPLVVRPRPGQQQLATLSLYDAIQVSKYDQFELSVISFVLKESLVQHLSEYIFTTLVEESRQRAKDSSDTASTSSSIATSQDTNNSDSNNNTSNNTNKSSLLSNNQISTTGDKQLQQSGGVYMKEFPVDRYVNLAFAYFDLTHTGHVHADDLFKLFNNTGLTISKRALWSLIGEGDKFNYRTLADLSPKFPPTYVYHFPDQFNVLPGTSSSSTSASQEGDGGAPVSHKIIEYQGVKYDVEKLIQQVREAETNRVNMVERFNHAIENFDKQAEEIHVLEVSRVTYSKAIASLNNEVQELKRQKESIEERHKALKKGIKSTAKALGDLVSNDEK